MSTHRLILIGGGVRSGKSAFALRRGQALGPARVFVATAQAFDSEMEARIALHRQERDDTFRTIEEPVELIKVFQTLRAVDVVVVDCLTLWVSNLLVAGQTQDEILACIDALVKVLCQRSFHVVLVTNEVGLGIVPESALGRVFRDISGLMHQRLAEAADEVYAGLMGVILRLKPGPVEAVS